MGRTATLPPSKAVGIKLSLEVLEAIEDAVENRGLNKRAIYEIALRRELGLDPYPGAVSKGKTQDGQLPLAS